MRALIPLSAALAVLSTAASGQELSGTWNGHVTCNQQYLELGPWPITIVATHQSGSRYSLSVSLPNGSGSGRIEGNRVNFTTSNFLNTTTFQGSVSGATMSGSYTQSINSSKCSWRVAKVGGLAGAGKNRQGSSDRKEREPAQPPQAEERAKFEAERQRREREAAERQAKERARLAAERECRRQREVLASSSGNAGVLRGLQRNSPCEDVRLDAAQRLAALNPAAQEPVDVATPQPAQGRRVALVIGNGSYRHAEALANPRNDAADIATALTRLNFVVTKIDDSGFEAMRLGLLEFGHRAHDAEIAVVFFAGHGMAIESENWLIPVDAQLRTENDVNKEAISLKVVMQTVAAASKLGLVLLDACRNNPFAGRMQRVAAFRAMTRGLERVEPVGSVLVAFAARDGTTAADGQGRNSPFTRALLKHLETPGLEINLLFRRIRDDVIQATRKQQEPWTYGSLSGEQIFLKPVPREKDDAGTRSSAASALDDYQLAKEIGTAQAWNSFIARHPTGYYADLARAHLAKLGSAAPEKAKSRSRKKSSSQRSRGKPAGGTAAGDQ